MAVCRALVVSSFHVRFGSKADICGAKDNVRFGPIADIRSQIERPPRGGLFSFSCAAVQTVATCALFFLRQPSRPKAPRPVAKSGRAAGSGVAATGVPMRSTEDTKVKGAKPSPGCISAPITKMFAEEASGSRVVGVYVNVSWKEPCKKEVPRIVVVTVTSLGRMGTSGEIEIKKSKLGNTVNCIVSEADSPIGTYPKSIEELDGLIVAAFKGGERSVNATTRATRVLMVLFM